MEGERHLPAGINRQAFAADHHRPKTTTWVSRPGSSLPDRQYPRHLIYAAICSRIDSHIILNYTFYVATTFTLVCHYPTTICIELPLQESIRINKIATLVALCVEVLFRRVGRAAVRGQGWPGEVLPRKVQVAAFGIDGRRHSATSHDLVGGILIDRKSGAVAELPGN